MKATPRIPRPDEGPRMSVWDEVPWFAVARFSGTCCTGVLMTRSWDAYAEEYRKLAASTFTFEVWCGTYRDVEDFRKRCYARKPHESSS